MRGQARSIGSCPKLPVKRGYQGTFMPSSPQTLVKMRFGARGAVLSLSDLLKKREEGEGPVPILNHKAPTLVRFAKALLTALKLG